MTVLLRLSDFRHDATRDLHAVFGAGLPGHAECVLALLAMTGYI